MFSPEDLVAHATWVMDRATRQAREAVACWRAGGPEALGEILEELEAMHNMARAHHAALLTLFARHDLLLDADGATPLDARTNQLDADFQELTLAVVDAHRNPAPAALQ